MSRPIARMFARTMLACSLCAAVLAMGGCDLFSGSKDWTEKPEVSGSKPDAAKPTANNRPRGSDAPAYEDIARRYNLERVRYLDRVSARANILITYYDEEGNEKTEDPEGRLQVVRPNKLALSLGKAGQTMFWLGCDPEQYWWLDLSDKSKRIAAIGRHENFTDATAQRIGLPIKPLDLIRVLGVIPLDPAAKGATQWSNDRKLVGVTSPIGDRGFQRLWIEPGTLRPTMVEVFDRDREKILVAEHEGEERVEILRDVPGASMLRVFMPSRVHITHLPTDTRARLTLSGVKDGPITDKAFDLRVLLEKYPVDKAIDLDAQRAK